MQRPQTITALITIVAALMAANLFVKATPTADAQAIVGSEATFVSTPRVVSISTVVSSWTADNARRLNTTRAWSDGVTEYRVDLYTSNGIFVPGEWIALD